MVPVILTLRPPAQPTPALALKLNAEVLLHLRTLHQNRLKPRLVVKDGHYVCTTPTSKPQRAP